ncbi:MAG: ferritin-like domain-containing protein, partial [Candidatus Thorarchaeota archaeon]
DAYHHESIVTERIYKIGDIADRLGDRSTQSMLNWFYNEQTEEEALFLHYCSLTQSWEPDHLLHRFQLNQLIHNTARKHASNSDRRSLAPPASAFSYAMVHFRPRRRLLMLDYHPFFPV